MTANKPITGAELKEMKARRDWVEENHEYSYSSRIATTIEDDMPRLIAAAERVAELERYATKKVSNAFDIEEDVCSGCLGHGWRAVGADDSDTCGECMGSGMEKVAKMLCDLRDKGDICANHNTEVCGGGCWVCATIHSHPDREKLVNALRAELKKAHDDVGTLLSDLKDKDAQIEVFAGHNRMLDLNWSVAANDRINLRKQVKAWRKAADAAKKGLSHDWGEFNDAYDAACILDSMDDWHPRAQHKLDTLNYEGLDQKSLGWAKELLLELKQHDIKPNRIVRTAEATISMWFKGEVKSRVECCDDGYVLSIIDEKNRHLPLERASSVVGALIAEEVKAIGERDDHSI